jgi:hypothetical protein
LDEFSYRALGVDELPAVVGANTALAASDVYLAGAAQSLGPIAEALLAAGVPPAQLHVEPL